MLEVFILILQIINVNHVAYHVIGVMDQHKINVESVKLDIIYMGPPATQHAQKVITYRQEI